MSHASLTAGMDDLDGCGRNRAGGTGAAIMINPKVDRRAILSSAGLGAAAAVGGIGFPARALPTRRVHYVVTDSRFAEAGGFADALATQGAVTLDVARGLTALWRARLLPHWRGGGGAVVGLTTSAAWHTLAEQARGEGRRSFLVGRHDIGAGGMSAVHVITVPQDARAAASRMPGDADRWPAAMAALAAVCASTGGLVGAPCRVASGPPVATDNAPLLSWIIA